MGIWENDNIAQIPVSTKLIKNNNGDDMEPPLLEWFSDNQSESKDKDNSQGKFVSKKVTSELQKPSSKLNTRLFGELRKLSKSYNQEAQKQLEELVSVNQGARRVRLNKTVNLVFNFQQKNSSDES